MKRKMMMIGLALSVIAGGVFAAETGNAVQAAPQETAIAKNVEKFSKKFNENRAYQTIYHLSETIGPRVTGTAEEKRAPLLSPHR